MGNHEWCEICCVSCNHGPGDCPPEKVVAYKAEIAAQEERKKILRARMAEHVEILKSKGYDARLEISSYGYWPSIQISDLPPDVGDWTDGTV